MNPVMEIVESGFGPLFMSISDMLLIYYICGNIRGHVRRTHQQALWFGVCLILLVVCQLIFSGKTNPQANFLVFYIIHFLVLLFYSQKCTDAPVSVRIYLVILSVLANDICLILLISLSLTVFHFDYIDEGVFLERVISHFVLLGLKFAATVSVVKFLQKLDFSIRTTLQAVIVLLPALPYFFLRNYAFFFKISPMDVPVIIHYLNVLFGISAMTNMIIGEQLSYRIRKTDQLQVEKLARQHYNHYLSSLKTIETVNRKYHDLRYIIRGIESMESLSEIKKSIRSLHDEIQNYELILNTGNKTLDVILSDWMQEAKDKNIPMHVHADGQGWEAVRDVDIATVFGNALDNAIESSERDADASARFIDVRTGRVNDMLIARFENRLTHKIERSQTRLRSTKQDPGNHGYGLQSIEMVIRKYGGEMDINTENGSFVLTIIVPALLN